MKLIVFRLPCSTCGQPQAVNTTNGQMHQHNAAGRFCPGGPPARLSEAILLDYTRQFATWVMNATEPCEGPGQETER